MFLMTRVVHGLLLTLCKYTKKSIKTLNEKLLSLANIFLVLKYIRFSTEKVNAFFGFIRYNFLTI